MAVTILDSQLQLLLVDGDAKPDVFINPGGHIICHLTKGFQAGTFPLGQSDALTAGAHVPLGGDPRGTPFWFVHIGPSHFHGPVHPWRIPRGGSGGGLAHVPPALANPIMLDASGTAAIPFFQDPSRTSFIRPKIHTTWGDHPASKVPSKLKNSLASNVDNFLFQFIDDRDFWTIFTAQDPDGTLRYIANFRWKIRYDVEFMWRNNQAVLRRSKSVVPMLQRNRKGRPPEPEVQSLLTTPVGPRAHVAFGGAITQAFFGPRGPNRSENPRPFTTVPGDFCG